MSPNIDMQTTTKIRLPGVYFLPPDRPAIPTLPPLDVAAFVGFAERGPLHLPVAIEDMDVFRAIFGSDCSLAREQGDKTVYACLPTAVQAFFANGGRRCYVVRVAGESASATRLSLPGMISLAGDGLNPRLVPINTATPGNWGKNLRIGSRLQITALPRSAFSVTGHQQLDWDTGSAPLAVQTGDLLQVWVGQRCWLFPVTSVNSQAVAVAKTPVQLSAARLFRVLKPDDLPTPLWFPDTLRVTLDGIETLALESLLRVDRDQLVLEIDRSAVIMPGDILWLKQDQDDRGYLFPVADARQVKNSGSPLQDDLQAVTGSLISLADAENLPLGVGIDQVDRLRFDLHLWENLTRLPPLQEMAFNHDHPRFWGEIIYLESSSLGRNTPAHTNGNLSVQAVAYFRAVKSDKRSEEPEESLKTIALAGLLAPVSESEAGRIYLPVGMLTLLAEERTAIPKDGDVGQNGLSSFNAGLFLDQRLAGNTSKTLLGEAFELHYIAEQRLHGLHGLMFIDEVALLALPDAIHNNWKTLAPPPAAHLQIPPAPPVSSEAFEDCDLLPGIASVIPAAGELSGGVQIAITGSRFTDDDDTIILFGDQLATAVHILGPTLLTCLTPLSPVTGTVTITLSNSYGTAQAPGAFTFVRSTDSALPETPPAADYIQDTLLQIQQAMLTFCETRRDVVAIMGLPRHYEKRQCIDWQESLRQKLGLPRQRQPSPEDVGLLADLSFAAVYHPWHWINDRSNPSSLRLVPPEGAICGLIAARERERGVWVAPANQPLQGIVGLSPVFSEADWADLFDLQFNLVRREPRDDRAMSAHTLSDDRDLLQLSVRRLLILLRKTAMARGMDFVFESNNQRLWENARLTLEAMLQGLFERGAFAGATAQQAYRVNTGASLNTRQRVDQGQFIAQIQVAPSQPMEFITILLTRASEGVLQASEA